MLTGAAIKGLSFNQSTSMIRRLAVPTAYEQWHAALTDEARALVDQPPLAGVWVPIAPFRDVIEKGYAIAYRGKDATMREHGRIGIAEDLRGVYRLFVKLMSPEFTIRRAAAMWEMYYRGNGRLTAKPIEHGCDVLYKDTVMPSAGFWQVNAGTLEGVLEVIGVKSPRVEIVAGGDTAPDCTIRCSWAP